MKKMLHALLDQVELPRVFRYTQAFPDKRLDDIPATLARTWAACPAAKAVRPGMADHAAVKSHHGPAQPGTDIQAGMLAHHHAAPAQPAGHTPPPARR